MDWSKFAPTDFEYDFENDELFAQCIAFKELSKFAIYRLLNIYPIKDLE